MFPLGDITRNNKGAVFNIVFSLLVITCGSWYIGQVKLIRDFHHTNSFIAFLLLASLFAEPWALRVKINSIYAGEHEQRGLGARYIFLWITHIVVTVMTIVVLDNAMPPPLEQVSYVFYVLIGIKEFWLFGYLLNRQITDEPKDDKGVTWKQPKKFSNKQIFMADVVLTVYGFLLFGATWQSMGASGFLGGMMNDLADSYVFRVFTYTLMFFMIYFPIRLAHFIEEWLTRRRV